MTDESSATGSDLGRRAERAVAGSRRLLDRVATEHESTAADEARLAETYDDLARTAPSALRTEKAHRARERSRDARERARDTEDRHPDDRP